MRDIPELAKVTGFWIRDLEVTFGVLGFIDAGYLLFGEGASWRNDGTNKVKASRAKDIWEKWKEQAWRDIKMSSFVPAAYRTQSLIPIDTLLPSPCSIIQGYALVLQPGIESKH